MLAAGGMDPRSKRVQAGSVLAAGNTIDIAKLFFPQLDRVELEKMVARIDAIFFENGIRCSVPVRPCRDAGHAGRDGHRHGRGDSDGTRGSQSGARRSESQKHLP